METGKNKLNKLVMITILFFPILPQYVYVTGRLNIVNLFAVFVFAGFIITTPKFKLYKFYKNIAFFWIFQVVYIFSCVAGNDYFAVIARIVSYICIPIIILFSINTRGKFMSAINTLIAGGTILGIFGIAESVTQTNIFQLFAGDSTVFYREIRYGLLRIMTTFGQPIAYGIYQVFIAGLILYMLHNDISEKQKTRLRICNIIVVLNIFLSLSRLPIMGYILLLLLIAYRKSKRKFIEYCFYAGIASLIFILFISSSGIEIPLFSPVVRGISSVLEGNETSVSVEGFGNRLILFSWVISSMKPGAWVFGNGITTEFAYQVYSWQTKTSIENYYLYVFYHLGIIGVIVLLGMYISTLIYAHRGIRRKMKFSNEGSISFYKIIIIMFSIYYILVLGVQETDISRMYAILVMLLISYNSIVKLENSSSLKQGDGGNEHRAFRI